MKFLSLTISGFKNHKQAVSYNFGKINNISGSNYSGKTSIGEALVFALFGISFNGESKRTEDLINNESNQIDAHLVWLDNLGVKHELTRIKDRKSQIIRMDESEETSQNDINVLVGDHDLFLSMFNLYYFNEILEDKERRAMFVKYSPIIDMMRLFSEFADTNLIRKYDISIHKQSEYTRMNKIRNEMDKKTDEFKKEIQVINQQIINDQTSLASWNEDRSLKLTNISRQIYSLEQQLESLAPTPQLKSADSYPEYAELIKKLCQITFMEIPKFSDMSNLQSCPLCYTTIQPEHRNQILSYQQNEIQRVIAYNEQTKTYEQSLRNEIDQFKQKINQENIDISQKVDLYNNTITQIAVLKQTYSQLENNINPLENNIKSNKERITQIENSIKESKENLVELSKICSALAPSTGIYRKAVEEKTKLIQNEFTRCSIMLERQLKSGEMQECFDIYFDGKPYRRLSHSERILCNLEIGKFFRNRSEKNVPIFVDNAESISSIPQELLDSEQVFISVVMKDQPLTVQIIGD